MRSVWADRIGIISLFLLVGVFFGRLFYPTPQLIVTPDYGRSDAWHFSFVTKFALSQALQSHTLPLWRSDVGQGFPLLAEGQTGVFFLPNLVFFSLFEPVTAYNLTLTLAVLTLGLGIYWWCRVMRLSPLSSWFTAVTVMFSSLTITQLPHITLLQGMSMLPIIATLSILVVTSKPFPWGGLLALSLSQQIYAGFPQATFLTLVISGVIVLWLTLPNKNWRAIWYWSISLLLGIGGGAMQLLPSWEFLKESPSPSGFSPEAATMYSMPIKHLVSFISPFFLGNPANGTYPPFYAFDGSIFWENTAYIGLIPLFLLVLSLFRIRKNPTIIFWWLVVIVSLTLAGGKYAPTYIVFSIWPLNLFRVPSRFLWLVIIGISFIAAHTFDTLRRHIRTPLSYIFIYSLMALHSGQLMYTWWSYHLIEPAALWIEAPDLKNYVGPGRVLTIGDSSIYNDMMITTGWSKPEGFRSLKDSLSPNSNILWGVDQAQVYAGRYLHRPAIGGSLLDETVTIDAQHATISALHLANMYAIGNVVSFLPLTAPPALREAYHKKSADFAVTLYTNDEALPRAYTVHEATIAATLKDAILTLRNPDFRVGSSVMLEQHEVKNNTFLSQLIEKQPHTLRNTQADHIAWQTDAHVRVDLAVTMATPGLLVLADTHYPGWIATVDDKETPIFAANLSQRAIIVPEGTHEVSFIYAPLTLRWGAIISAISAIITALLMIALKRNVVVHTPKKAQKRASHRPRTHRT
jgi:hypothetical protein